MYIHKQIHIHMYVNKYTYKYTCILYVYAHKPQVPQYVLSPGPLQLFLIIRPLFQGRTADLQNFDS
jgi:hypothetical protein